MWACVWCALDCSVSVHSLFFLYFGAGSDRCTNLTELVETLADRSTRKNLPFVQIRFRLTFIVMNLAIFKSFQSACMFCSFMQKRLGLQF